MVMLASLRAHLRPGVSSSDFAQEKAKAREIFNRAIKALDDDLDMHVEVARLWQEKCLDRTTRALKEALRLSEANKEVDPQLLNNMGAVQHMEGNLAEARALYEDSLTKAASLGPDVGEGMSTSILYNLARVYEDGGDDAMAKEAYNKLLARHPEYVDAKVRQAQMLADLNQSNEAHDLLKQAMASQNTNLNLRAFYTYFLIQSNFPKPAKDFVLATLMDHDKRDVYSLCAAGQ
ncbi:TPR-like protein [Suillus weaverae]|nr:TPR-like protein [Suillus weaverae]